MGQMFFNHCAVCGKQFGSSSRYAAYCSPKCKNKAKSIRDKEKHKAPVSALHIKGETGGCKGCTYWAQNSCDYIGYHQKCRPARVRKGGGCDCYSPIPGEHRCTYDTLRAKRMLAKGLDTLEVAKRLSANENSIKALRHGREV